MDLARKYVEAWGGQRDVYYIVINRAGVKRHARSTGGIKQAGYSMHCVGGVDVLECHYHTRRGYRQRLCAGNRPGNILKPAARFVGTQESNCILRCCCERKEQRSHSQAHA